MFRIDRLGNPPELRWYADLDGRVPEVGDAIERFRYPNDRAAKLANPNVWEQWVEEATQMTASLLAPLT